MREISANDMNIVSGAYSWDFSNPGYAIKSVASNGFEAVRSIAFGTVIGGITGGLTAGTHAGDGGGLLGFGALGQLVGAGLGIGGGAIAGATGGLLAGWDVTFDYGKKCIDAILNGTLY